MPAGTTLSRRHIAAATIGNALDVYDFIIYATFSIQIGHAFFAAKDPTVSLILSLLLFGAGFLIRPLGGWIIGRYSDRIGRRAAMTLTLYVSGAAVVALALIPSYAQIGIWATVLAAAVRLVQGFALGGETGTAAAYLLEASAPEHRGLSVSWQGASTGIAGAIGAGVGALMAHYLSPADFDTYGWRAAFLLGGLAVPFGIYLRSTLPETLDRPEEKTAVAEKPPLQTLITDH